MEFEEAEGMSALVTKDVNVEQYLTYYEIVLVNHETRKRGVGGPKTENAIACVGVNCDRKRATWRLQTRMGRMDGGQRNAIQPCGF